MLEVRNLCKYFPLQRGIFLKARRYIKAVEDVSLKVEEGSTLGVVGESGSGKTTLALSILHLHEPTSGRIFFDSQDFTFLDSSQERIFRQNLQIVFQNPFSSLDERYRVSQTLYESMYLLSLSKAEKKERVLTLLKDVALSKNFLERFPHQLSGGQRQKVCIARALGVDPRLLILDEPTSSLDAPAAAEIITLLKELQKKRNLSYIFISHNLKLVRNISHRILVMFSGVVMEEAETEVLWGKPLHPYTKLLIQASQHKLKEEKLSFKEEEGGCQFRLRCPYSQKICKDKAPLLKEVEPSHLVRCHLFNS